ncbi:MAG: 3-hydroxybutyryl-CoA dehydrogenase [Deltaproteobacteria bacterium]|nr:3-hydroxybutyryl-CoA dehydrogenase [Deltaproteobacteria bacterium]
MRRVGVIGGGLMGSEIAYVAASHLKDGQVTVVDLNDEILARSRARIRAVADKAVSRGKATRQAADEWLGRLAFTASMDGLSSAEIVIEAVTENLSMKRQVFAELDRRCGPQAILATNTSSLPITAIASATSRPQQVIGLHFFNPVSVMRLVEIVRGYETADAVYEAARAFCEELGKETIVARDIPGFITTRVGILLVNEAIFALYEGIGTAADIDRGIKLGYNHPMGPLELADLIGLDTVLNVITTLYEGFKDPKYRPCPLLKQMVDAGHLGRKSGRGFYTYGAA